MPDFNRFLHNVLSDLRVELTDEFDRNFERKAFFNVPWAMPKRAISKGSLLLRTGALRSSIQSRVDNNSIAFSSSLPYAALHNEGGVLTVTPKMKKFFWAMYYKTSGAITTKKSGAASKSKKNAALSAEAMYWKALALMKAGAKLTIPKRQFIGWHEAVNTNVRAIIDDNAQEVIQDLKAELQQLSPRFKAG